MIEWNFIQSAEQIARLSADSYQKPVIIFKHSYSCGLSHIVLSRFEREFNADCVGQFLLIDVVKHRAVSQQIAGYFQIEHASPQILVLAADEVLYSASHYGIDADAVQKAIKSLCK
ncbi:MAG: bacillithiol system redox-active protein YtxJ [Chitinophagales bacterium]